MSFLLIHPYAYMDQKTVGGGGGAGTTGLSFALKGNSQMII